MVTTSLTTWQQRQQKQSSTRAGKRTKGEWISIDGEGWGRDELGRQLAEAALERAHEDVEIPF